MGIYEKENRGRINRYNHIWLYLSRYGIIYYYICLYMAISINFFPGVPIYVNRYKPIFAYQPRIYNNTKAYIITYLYICTYLFILNYFFPGSPVVNDHADPYGI